MAVPSLMVPIGTPAPDFTLPDLTGAKVSLGDFAASPALLIVFACNHCPYVQHLEQAIGALAGEHPQLAVVAVCTNDATAYPDDDPEHLAAQAERAGWAFPYLIDADQSVGRAYQAACTPDFFLYGPERLLAYRGAFDDSTPGNGKPVTGADLRTAIAGVLAGETVPEPHRPSLGCSIKWAS